MTPSQVEETVQRDLTAYEAAPPAPSPTVGIPWSDLKLRESIAALRASLVKPYMQRFHLKDTGEQMRTSSPEIAVYWVIAETGHYLEFYDPESREYGLAVLGRNSSLPETIGIRGDLLGVFGAK